MDAYVATLYLTWQDGHLSPRSREQCPSLSASPGFQTENGSAKRSGSEGRLDLKGRALWQAHWASRMSRAASTTGASISVQVDFRRTCHSVGSTHARDWKG